MIKRYLTDMDRMEYDLETKRNETKRNETKRNETKRVNCVLFCCSKGFLYVKSIYV